MFHQHQESPPTTVHSCTHRWQATIDSRDAIDRKKCIKSTFQCSILRHTIGIFVSNADSDEDCQNCSLWPYCARYAPYSLTPARIFKSGNDFSVTFFEAHRYCFVASFSYLCAVRCPSIGYLGCDRIQFLHGSETEVYRIWGHPRYPLSGY
jgi:hypothetical protein